MLTAAPGSRLTKKSRAERISKLGSFEKTFLKNTPSGKTPLDKKPLDKFMWEKQGRRAESFAGSSHEVRLVTSLGSSSGLPWSLVSLGRVQHPAKFIVQTGATRMNGEEGSSCSALHVWLRSAELAKKTCLHPRHEWASKDSGDALQDSRTLLEEGGESEIVRTTESGAQRGTSV